MPHELENASYDLGHRGKFDYTQIAQFLRMTPTERLARMEGWRGFAKEALSNAGLRKENYGTNLTLQIGDESLDLPGEMSGIGGFDDVIAHAETLSIQGVHVRVLSLPDLIASKRAAGRPKDLAMISLIEATLQVKHRGSEQ